MKPTRVAIIGGGCSGTLAALQLITQSQHTPLEIVIIEKSGELGRGLAYSVPSDRCKLNVPANAMGAFPEAPGGFFDWLLPFDSSVTPDEFVSRERFGRYLQSLLNDHLQRYQPSWRHVTDEALDLEFDPTSATFTVSLATAPAVVADFCVLALGNMPRTTFQGLPVKGLLHSPYNAGSYADIQHAQELLIVGSGLTAVDCILEAEGRGFQGRFTVVSRHGRLPLAHEAPSHTVTASLAPVLQECEQLRTLPLRQLTRLITHESRRAGSSQPVINTLRPHIQEIWKARSSREKKTFLRHIRSIWEVHRHRIPRSHLEKLNALTDSTRLKIFAGRIESISCESGFIKAEIRTRLHSQQHSFDRAMLCAGPESDLSRIRKPLVQNLLRRGVIEAGELALGAVIGGSALPKQHIHRLKLLGALQRESLWEITAVREIRLEAAKIAREIVRSREFD
jgi:uncharacterized NAD(P)/FAD-binding protein YdhS